jgi:CreA protein
MQRIFSPLFAAAAFTHFRPRAEAAATSSSREVSSFETSGILLKDTLKVYALQDPKVEGVTLYFSDIELHTLEKLANFFNDPSSTSLTCVLTGPIRVHRSASFSKEGEDVYLETKNLLFKVTY